MSYMTTKYEEVRHLWSAIERLKASIAIMEEPFGRDLMQREVEEYKDKLYDLEWECPKCKKRTTGTFHDYYECGYCFYKPSSKFFRQI